MAKIAAFLLVGIALGFSIAIVSQRQDQTGTTAASADISGADAGSLSRRLGALETEIALERGERQALATELARLREAIGELPAVSGPGESQPARATERNDRGGSTQTLVMSDLSSPERDERLRQRQLDQFVAAGLPRDRAQWIMQREQELTMDILQARYEATRDGASEAEVAQISESRILREELGDADYEKYLEGRGRPTSINVNSVIENSPAQAAGLRAGDQITAYNGKRVFDMAELTSLTFEVEPGQAVPIDVVRDGQAMQIFVPSGAMGFSGGGRATRRNLELRD